MLPGGIIFEKSLFLQQYTPELQGVLPELKYMYFYLHFE